MGQTKSPVECFYNVYFSFVEGVDNMKKHIEALKLKRMNAEVIGTWAGQVWNALNESGKLTVKGLKKATKLKEKELYAALGWLAREGKVSMYEVDADIEVVLL